MLRPSNDWPGVAFEVEATPVGLTVGVATPLWVLLFPWSSDSLRFAGDSSPRWLSGSMIVLSGPAELAETWSWDAPATLTSVAAAVATSDTASTAFQRRFEHILSPFRRPGARRKSPQRTPSSTYDIRASLGPNRQPAGCVSGCRCRS